MAVYFRSDSNQDSDNIAIFLSLILGFQEQHLKIYVQSVHNEYICPTEDLDFDYPTQEICLWKTLAFFMFCLQYIS